MRNEDTTAGESIAQAEHTRSGNVYRPHVDITEGADELVVHADVPGVRGEDVEIDFNDGTLTLHARVRPRQAEETDYLVKEFGVGDFHRTFQVSEQIDAGNITADFKNGVLSLHLPKVEAVKPRKISVQSS